MIYADVVAKVGEELDTQANLKHLDLACPIHADGAHPSYFPWVC